MNERRPAVQAADGGFTLIEVVVALLVFAIVSTGIVASMTTIIQMTAENRARIAAANLASQELDTVRAISDVYSVQSAPTKDIPVDGRTYHLARTVSWVSSSGADVSCNSSTNLFYLRVNVRVSWDGMLGTTSAVQDDTILSPSDGSTDSAFGAIAVFVSDEAGASVVGAAVNVQVAPGGLGAAPSPQPKNTTADGCTYANNLKPGSYTVTVSKTGYADRAQASSTTQTVTVNAGSTVSTSFVLARPGTVTTEYTIGPRAYNGSAIKPSNLPTNFTVTGSTYTTSPPASSVLLYPFSSPYWVTAGPAKTSTTSCASVDPQAWVAGTVNGVALAGGVTPTVTVPAAGTARVRIPMGVVVVHASPAATLTATQGVATGQGNPGCGIVGTTLSFPVTGNGGQVALALPYGSWRVLANGVPLTAADLSVPTNTSLPGVSLDGTVTLDPRATR